MIRGESDRGCDYNYFPVNLFLSSTYLKPHWSQRRRWEILLPLRYPLVSSWPVLPFREMPWIDKPTAIWTMRLTKRLHVIHPLGSTCIHSGTATLKFVQEALHSTMTSSALFLLLNTPNPFSNGKREPTVLIYFIHVYVMLLYTSNHLCKHYFYIQRLLTVDTGKARTLKRRSLLEIMHLAHRSFLISLNTSARKDTP